MLWLRKLTKGETMIDKDIETKDFSHELQTAFYKIAAVSNGILMYSGSDIPDEVSGGWYNILNDVANDIYAIKKALYPSEDTSELYTAPIYEIETSP